MSVSSLREYLDLLDTTGWLRSFDQPVSWDLEASAATMLANIRDGPIPVFESIAGLETESKLVGDPYRGPQTRPWDHFARALGLSGGLSGRTYYDRVIDRLNAPQAPRTVASQEAPCKETVRTGNEVDLLSFPWPYIHEGDGGRYSNHHTIVAPDPDTEWGTWSSHRMMIHDFSQASLLLLAGEQVPNRYYYDYEPGRTDASRGRHRCRTHRRVYCGYVDSDRPERSGIRGRPEKRACGPRPVRNQ